jgi:thymidylate synthase
MAQLITGNSLTHAWRKAVIALLDAPQHEIYDLLVEVTHPELASANGQLAVDQYLVASGLQRLDRVANTIFPARRAARARNRAAFYAGYERILPRVMRRDRRNQRGTYFSRIIRFPLQPDPTRSNQLERVITDLQVNPDRRMRHIYEIQVFAPGRDLRPEGFPCLSSLSLHVEAGLLRLAATYRNQFYVERGLGNFIGLARLQRYIASEAGLQPGELSVHAFHAALDRPIREVRPLLERLEAAEGA